MYNNMIPFGHNRLFDLFDSFDQELLPTMTGSFRTDILDRGDAYVLQAELPGFRKEDIALRDKVEELLIEMKKDGTLEKISTQWFGSDITVVPAE